MSSSCLNPTRGSLLETFALDVEMVEGSGTRLIDADGNTYLDFLSQYGALPFGHNPPHVWSAIAEGHARRVPAMVQPLRPVIAERLAEMLASITPGDLSITTFTNSGAETVEAAIKLARVRTGRPGILSTMNGFHGKTLAALSATGKPMYQKGFEAPAPGFDHVPFGDLDALEQRFSADAGRIAAFIVEPIQGEGGVIVPPEGYLDGVIRICRRYGVLSIIDEIQTGLGRTGSLFACSDCPETPDMLLLAKALGGGVMPIGACIVRPDVWDDRFGRLHSSTFANNNIACLAALATLEALLADQAELVRRVAANGTYFTERLRSLQDRFPQILSDVRGRGYMIGIEFAELEDRGSATLAYASLNGGVTPLVSSYLLNVHGVLTAPLFNTTRVLRLQPPLVATRDEIDRVVAAIEATCAALASGDVAEIVGHLVRTLPAPLEDAEATMVRPASPRPATPPLTRPNEFAFLIHYTEKSDVLHSDPSLVALGEDGLGRWLDWVKRLGPGTVRTLPTIRSKTGAVASGCIMSVPMLPQDMQGAGRSQAVAMIRDAAQMAAAAGAGRLGLGAYTSIVTRGGETAAGYGPAVTSGNTLTTVSAVKAIRRVAERSGLALRDAHVAVVGATGAIGRLAAMMLARDVAGVTLIGNASNPFAPRLLANVAREVAAVAEIARQLAGRPGEIPLLATTDLSTIRAADIVLVATSSEVTLVDPRTLTPGTIVCDIARPPNVAHAEMMETEVLVFDGGLVEPPFELDLGPFQTLPVNLCWGCLGETMLLALAGEARDISLGSRLSLEDADHIARLAEVHGFEPARTQWYGTMVEEDAYMRLFDARDRRCRLAG